MVPSAIARIGRRQRKSGSASMLRQRFWNRSSLILRGFQGAGRRRVSWTASILISLVEAIAATPELSDPHGRELPGLRWIWTSRRPDRTVRGAIASRSDRQGWTHEETHHP